MNTITKEHLDPMSELLAEQLDKEPDYRVLRALPQPFAQMPGNGAPPDGRCIAIVDCETSSLEPANGSIIEIAIKLLFVDEKGQLLGHLPIFSQLQDPGAPLESEIVRLTGLRDEDLVGRRIDDGAVARPLDRADLIVAHNARFDREWIERRWPNLRDRDWACSCVEIDWPALDFEGRSQPFLLQQSGWFARAHRAADDVWSLFWLLMQSRHDPVAENGDKANPGEVPERTHLQRLLSASDRATVRVEAVGANFGSKELLRARNYRWDADPLRKVWWREITPEDVEAEQLWFQRQGLPAPRLVPVTARDRHR
jgi:DNA polymerase-3 subunit epsilon